MEKKIAIVGAGLRGLCLGYYLRKLNPKLAITIYEKENKVGGWIDSKKTEYGILERGPRTIRSSGEGSWNLAEITNDLGLDSEVFVVDKTSPAGKNRAIIINGKVQLIPSSLSALVKMGFGKELLNFGLKYKHMQNNEDLSVQEFFTRNFGSKMANLSSAMCHGIYATDPSQLSLKNNFSAIKELLQIGNGNLIVGLLKKPAYKPLKDLQSWPLISSGAMWGFKNGLSTLTDALQVYLQNNNCKIVTSTAGTAELQNNFNHIFWTCGHPNLVHKVPAQSIYVVNLVYKRISPFMEAFGILNTKSEMLSNPFRKDLLGIIFDSVIRPSKYDIFTVMMGGSNKIEYSENEAKEKASLHVQQLVYKDAQDPVHSSVSYQHDCIPYHPPGASNSNLDLNINNHTTILGQEYMGVGLTECARVAKSIAYSYCRSSN